MGPISHGVVSVEEARKVLEIMSEGMTDGQISELISQMQLMAENYLDLYKKSLTKAKLSTKLN